MTTRQKEKNSKKKKNQKAKKEKKKPREKTHEKAIGCRQWGNVLYT